METKETKFETRYKDVITNNKVFAQSENFEISNGNFIYRQEVIGQSMGGLNIYELTLTSKSEKEVILKRGGKP